MTTRPPQPGDDPESVCHSKNYFCGQIHLTGKGLIACRSHTKQEGHPPCRLAPVTGAKVCASHGAAKGSPGRNKALQRVEETRILGEVAKALAGIGHTGQPSTEALIEERSRAGRIARLLDQMVGELDLHPATTKTDTEQWVALNRALYGPDWKGDGKPHVLLALLGEWSDRHGKLTKSEIDANLDTRRLQLESAEIAQLETAVMASLAGIPDLTADQHNAFLDRLAEELRDLDPSPSS